MPSISQIINRLPRPIRLRFESIGGYVQGIIVEDQESLPEAQYLTVEETDFVKLVAFCYSANRFFKEGAEAARTAVDELQRFDIPGFQVGSVLFQGRNDNVVLGDKLAAELMRTFDGNPVQSLIISSQTMTDLVRNLARKLRHERHVG